MSETSAVAALVYKKLAQCHAKLAATSDPTSAGIPITLVPPRNAKYASKEQIGKNCTFFLHFTSGWFEHVDNKMMGLLYLHANNVQALVSGGMFANFTKATLLRPKAKVLAASHPEFRRLVDYEMFTPETIAKKCDAVLAEIGRLTFVDTPLEHMHAKVLEFCRNTGNEFFMHEPPLSQVRFALFDALHGFTNEAEYERGLVNDYAEELQGALKLRCVRAPHALDWVCCERSLTESHLRARARAVRARFHRYDDPLSPQRRLHVALDALPRWKGHVKAMRNALTGDEPSTSRLAGDDALDWYIESYKWVECIKVARETDAQRFYRLALATRIHLMRVLFLYSAAFELHVESIDEMIKIGEMLHYVCDHATLHVTYAFTYVTKWNPYALKMIIDVRAQATCSASACSRRLRAGSVCTHS